MINKDFLMGYAAGQANAGESGGGSTPVVKFAEMLIKKDSSVAVAVTSAIYQPMTDVDSGNVYITYGSGTMVNSSTKKVYLPCANTGGEARGIIAITCATPANFALIDFSIQNGTIEKRADFPAPNNNGCFLLISGDSSETPPTLTVTKATQNEV